MLESCCLDSIPSGNEFTVELLLILNGIYLFWLRPRLRPCILVAVWVAVHFLPSSDLFILLVVFFNISYGYFKERMNINYVFRYYFKIIYIINK